ncbi:FixH family protein [Dyadobacter sp. 32]|uniref:FixH family protein n=1 Tax=Dyadobacter sp. 32 TaxID=538966 RepID=UPI0011EFBD73
MKTLKLNWGAGIAITYMGFVAMILVLVIMSTRQKIDLVTTQYYTEELKFQDKIDKVKRAQSLPEQLSWEVSDDALLINYPSAMTSSQLAGTIRFYCPSNDKNDRIFKVNASDGVQIFPLSQIPVGRYQLQIDWKNGQETFWNEGVVVINH